MLAAIGETMEEADDGEVRALYWPFQAANCRRDELFVHILGAIIKARLDRPSTNLELY